MHTLDSLKQEYKTLAAAKVAFGIKANSWAALVAKLADPVAVLKAEVAKLKAEIEVLKQPSANAEYQSDYFKSAEAELIYSIVRLDGSDRINALQIGRKHYSDPKKEKQAWRWDESRRLTNPSRRRQFPPKEGSSG
jgi:cell division protein FtsB